MSGLDPGYLSFTDAIVKLTEELIATKKERDAALAEAREARAMLLVCELNSPVGDVDYGAFMSKSMELRTMLDRARAEREEVGHE